MKVSVSVTDFSWDGRPDRIGAGLRRVAERLDASEVDTLWVSDHLLQTDPNARVEDPMLEAYTTLGFLGAVTGRLRLGTLVSWTSIRPPSLLVKAVTTLDVLTGGRVWLGVGAGYQAQEAAMMGLPFEAAPERFERLEELLMLAHQMWRGDDRPFIGAHHRLERPLVCPPPVQAPHPPILVGGMGEHRTLPLVARYGDACNLFDVPNGDAVLARKLTVLDRACREAGRPRGDIEVTLATRIPDGETADTTIDRFRQLRARGVDHVIVLTTGPWHDAGLDHVSAAATRVRDS